MIPTNLDALEASPLLSEAGKARLADELGAPPAPAGADESIASFVSRRLGREAYEALVEPLMTGICGGDGDRLSLQATFPNLRALELEHGSVLRGLLAQSAEGQSARPPFLTLRSGMDTLVSTLAHQLERTRLVTGRTVTSVSRGTAGYEVTLDEGRALEATGVVVAAPAFGAVEILADLDPDLAAEHAEIPYASSAIVTLAYRVEDVPNPLAGYGYVVPSVEHSDVLACTWTSSKWESRAPEGFALIRVYAGRFGGRDVTSDSDDDLVGLARAEVRQLGIVGEPVLTRTQRWPRGMPQYILGHPERLERIDVLLQRHPGLAVAGAAYRGVGIPDCIRSGEQAANTVARALERVPG
jgi:oxygen-dependent protoporphyrinogen oxidase